LQSPPETISATSPNRSTADSDSDSTSTELCDEPDHLSDVDSEDLTSASDSYVIATDDEKHAGVEGSSTSVSTPARSYARSELMTTIEVPRIANPVLETGRNDEAASLSEISIAKITDQIRRLSAEDDNNATVPQAQNAHDNDELLVEDHSVERSQVTEMDLEPQDSVNYTLITPSSANATNSKAMNNYNYLSFKSNLDEGRKNDILHRAGCPKDAEEVNDVVRVSSEDIAGLRTNVAETINASRDDFRDQMNSSLDRNCDRFIAPLDASDELFESSVRCSRVYLDSRSDLDLNDASSRVSDIATESRSFYSRKYIMGHLPICPITMDNKLSKLSHDVYNAVNPEVSLTSPETRRDVTFGDNEPITIQTEPYSELRRIPKSPESTKSFSSGETMGPDSKPSSLTMSPRTPNRSDSRDFTIDKSIGTCSSISSDSKTLVLHSVSSDITHGDPVPIVKRTSHDRTSPSISTDSLRNKSDTSPKLGTSSSSDSTCSPSKVKSSERSFSSDLQSPVSANSIRYTTSYGKRGQDNVSDSPIDLSAATSPFYPIANPNQKTPSPYGVGKQRRCSTDSVDTSPDVKSISSKDSTRFSGYQAKLDATTKSIETKEGEISDEVSKRNDLFARPQLELSAEMNVGYTSKERNKADLSSYESIGNEPYRKRGDFAEDNADDPLSEKDVVPQLPHEKLDKHYLNYNYRRRDRSRLIERSSSSLERRCTDLKSLAAKGEFDATMAKKRSSDILEDMKHLEAKAFSDGSPDTSMLTKKSSDIWEGMKSLEARRQDTFSNSASSFSKQRLEIPDISVTSKGRKSYIVHPKINIDENSDSILKTISCNKSTDSDTDDGRESKVGVWTKVKPRKKGDNGRRSSDRALKIIQENSAILHKILACQAKKRLPDLEEISKEITISPINEEISKIFSPILEKMGLNEHEINEELARINFKDLDNMSATSVSEFDAKINEELTKLSLIDDAEQIDHLDVDEIISHDYLDTREALIDHKINEELSKLLANYEEDSPPSMMNLDKGSSSQNISEIEGLDLTSISTNVFSYKSSNDSIETRSDQESVHEAVVQHERFPFATLKYEQSLSPKSDIDIYRELEKLDKISSVQVLPDRPVEIPPKRLSPITYANDASPYPEVSSTTRYAPKTSPFDTMSLKSTYEPYKSFDFGSRPSPRDNLYTYDKPVESTFDYANSKPRLPVDSYDLHLKSPILSKESLEFRLRYDDEPPRPSSGEYVTAQDSRSTISLNAGSSYYGKGNGNAVTPTKYVSKEDKCLDIRDYSSDKPDLVRHNYSVLSPKEFSHVRGTDYDKSLGTLAHVMDSEQDIGSYLPTRHRDYNILSPNRQFRDHYFPSSPNHYTPKFSPDPTEEAQRSVASHPESPSKICPSKYGDLTSKGSNCYKKSTLSFGSIENTNKGEDDADTTPSPKTHFSPFPIRNNTRKPKELTLKLGLYSPKASDQFGQSKKS